jgi:galactarate dehydratase
VVDHAVRIIKEKLHPKYPGVDDVVGLTHTYGCGVVIDAPRAEVPIRTLRNLALNPNFGGQAMVIALGCEKLQPERLLSAELLGNPATPPIVRLQDEQFTGFGAMVNAILDMAEQRLRVPANAAETCPPDLVVAAVRGSDSFGDRLIRTWL